MIPSQDHSGPAGAGAASAATPGRPWTRRLRAMASGMMLAIAERMEGLADQRGQANSSHASQNHHHHHHGHGAQHGSSGHGGHDGGGTAGAGRNLFDSPLATKARRMAHQEQAAHQANGNAGAGQGAAANHAAGAAQSGHLTVSVPAPTGTVIPMPGGAPPIVIGPDGFLVSPPEANAAGGAPSAPLS